jgi:hypothetical protein
VNKRDAKQQLSFEQAAALALVSRLRIAALLAARSYGNSETKGH